jgi:transposase-like protein
MSYRQRIFPRYSEAFKHKVVSEIESGQMSLSEAKRVYDIPGGGTIQNWIEKLGKSQLLNKVVRIEMKDEKDRIKELERQKQALESALAQAQLKILSLESLIKVAEDHYRIDIKKNFEPPVSDKP